MLSVAHGIGDQMVKDALNVLFLSPEVVPFAKSGGLADVAGSLPITLKYGTVPVVRATGGLDDTINHFDAEAGTGNGFKFSRYESKAFYASIQEAVGLFQNAKLWKKIVANGMKVDFSWDRSAQRYMELYRSVMERPALERGKIEGP